jgi:hypothetical protein
VDAPSNRCLTLADFSVSGYSIDPTVATGTVYIFRKATADRGTSSTSANIKARDPYKPAALFAAKEAYSAEGTVANWELVAGPFPLSPVSALLAWQFLPGDEPECQASYSLAVVVEFAATQQCRASMTVRE